MARQLFFGDVKRGRLSISTFTVFGTLFSVIDNIDALECFTVFSRWLQIPLLGRVVEVPGPSLRLQNVLLARSVDSSTTTLYWELLRRIEA